MEFCHSEINDLVTLVLVYSNDFFQRLSCFFLTFWLYSYIQVSAVKGFTFIYDSQISHIDSMIEFYFNWTYC